MGVTDTFFTDVKLDRDFENDLNKTFGRSLALANLNLPVDGTKVKAKSSPDWAPIANVGLSYAFDSHWSAALSLRSEEHTSELQSLMRISYAVFCLKKKTISAL